MGRENETEKMREQEEPEEGKVGNGMARNDLGQRTVKELVLQTQPVLQCLSSACFSILGWPRSVLKRTKLCWKGLATADKVGGTRKAVADLAI